MFGSPESIWENSFPAGKEFSIHLVTGKSSFSTIFSPPDFSEHATLHRYKLQYHLIKYEKGTLSWGLFAILSASSKLRAFGAYSSALRTTFRASYQLGRGASFSERFVKIIQNSHKRSSFLDGAHSSAFGACYHPKIAASLTHTQRPATETNLIFKYLGMYLERIKWKSNTKHTQKLYKTYVLMICISVYITSSIEGLNLSWQCSAQTLLTHFYHVNKLIDFVDSILKKKKNITWINFDSN